MTEFASFDFETLPPSDAYRLTVSTVVPRRSTGLGLIGRMHGRGWVCPHTTDLFEMDRPGNWKG